MRYRCMLIMGLSANLVALAATTRYATAQSAEELESKFVLLWGGAINAKNKGNYEEAVNLCTQALELIKDQPTLGKLNWMCLSTRAEAWVAKGEYGKALADYTQSLRAYRPVARAAGARELADLFARRGEVRQKLGDLDGAVADFSEAMGLEPKRRYVYLTLRGDAWEQKGSYEKAEADYVEAVQFHPDQSPSIKYLGLAQRARMWTRQGDVDKAIQLCDEAIALKPADHRAFGLRAAAWQQKEEYNKAAADYNTAIRLAPDNVAYYAERAACYFEQRDTLDDGCEKAIADLSEALRLDPNNANYYFKRGFLLSLMGRHDRAMADFDKAIQLSPDASYLYAGRARVWDAKGELDKAIADFSEAIRLSDPLDPNYLPDYLEERAEVWRKKGDAQKADADLAEAARLKEAAGHSP